MKKVFKNKVWYVIAFVMSVVVASCSKDDSVDSLLKNTKVTVYVKDSNNAPVNEKVVYAFDEFAWGSNGGSDHFAQQSTTDAEGRAEFILGPADIDGEQETYRFQVRYTKNGQNKQKTVPATIKKGEDKTVNIQLD